MQIDLHNIPLKEAKEIINNNILYCIKNKVSSLEIIHGFNNGNKIKNYLNQKSLKEKYTNINYIQPGINNPGKTTIYFKINI